MYVQLYILFYMKHVTRFLLKPQELSEEKFCIAQVVHEFLAAFLHERYMTCALVPSLKVENIPS